MTLSPNIITHSSPPRGNALKYLFSIYSWEFFQVVTRGDYKDKLQASVAGMLEGYVTSHLIDMHWLNTLADYCSEDPDFCFSLGEFLGENLSWMRFQIQNNPTDEYWHQVKQ